METGNENNAVTPPRMPWNKGKLIGPKPPLQPKHVWASRTRLQLAGARATWRSSIWRSIAGYAGATWSASGSRTSLRMAMPSTLRPFGKARPVFRSDSRSLNSRARRLTNTLRRAGSAPGDFLFHSRCGKDRCLSTRQYARVISECLASIGLDPSLFGTHSLRRTKATLIYRHTGSLRAVQLLLGHTKVESTVRYLGIEVDDALAITEQIDV
jgi:integrase